MEKKKAIKERRLIADRKRKFIAYHTKKVAMKTPKTRVGKMPDTPLTPAQKALVSQAAENEQGRKETEAKLAEAAAGWRMFIF